jgi:hypothetical protein
MVTSMSQLRNSFDEHYLLDICDRVLEGTALRQHRFDFLRGDPDRYGRQAPPPPRQSFVGRAGRPGINRLLNWPSGLQAVTCRRLCGEEVADRRVLLRWAPARSAIGSW